MIAQNGQSLRLHRIADRLDQICLLGLFILLCFRLLPQEGFPPKHLYPLMLLISEGVVLFFVLIRRNTEKISVDMKDWLIALGGTCTVLLVENSGEPFQPEAGFILIMAGFILHFGAKLSLRRSFGIVPADRGIKSNGLYAIVRHPMYCGYIVSHIGFLIAKPSIWNIAVYVVAWTLFIARIRIEERLLSRNEEYRAYCDKVKYRFIPGVF